MLGWIVSAFTGCFALERRRPGRRVLDPCGSLPPAAGGAIAYFVATFVFCWRHRWRHEYDWPWRHSHPIRPSPQRLEVITSFYNLPVEMVVNSIVGALLVYAVLGLTPEAGALYAVCTALGELFYPTNCRTPRGDGRCGFDPVLEEPLPAMLAFRDVHDQERCR